MPARAGLDRAAVVQAAARIVDAKGSDALTLAELAADLGVRTPSLYNHIAGLDGLRRDLALCGVRELNLRLTRAAVGKAGDAAILAFADAYRVFAHQHPGLYMLSLRAPTSGDEEMAAASGEVVGTIIAVLGAYGLEGDMALHAVRGLRSICHGFVSLEAAGGFGLPLDRDASFHLLVQMFISGLADTRRQNPPRVDSMTASS